MCVHPGSFNAFPPPAGKVLSPAGTIPPAAKENLVGKGAQQQENLVEKGALQQENLVEKGAQQALASVST